MDQNTLVLELEEPALDEEFPHLAQAMREHDEHVAWLTFERQRETPPVL